MVRTLILLILIPSLCFGGYWFDGAVGDDDVIVVDDHVDLRFTTAFTISAWIKPDATITATAGIITKQDSPNDNGYILGVTGTNEAFCQTGDGTTWANGQAMSGDNTLRVGVWNHIAAVKEGSNLRIYVNGVLKATDSTTNTVEANTKDLWIGRNVDNDTATMHGSIGQVRVFNKVLTIAEIDRFRTVTPDSRCQGSWELDDNVGDWVADLSENKFKGNIIGAIPTVNPPVTPLPGVLIQ